MAVSHETQKAWTRALTLTAPYARGGGESLPAVVLAMAAQRGESPALIDEHFGLSYAALARRMNRAARWALTQSVAPGDVVGLMLPNCADYVAIWMGIVSVRGVVALINPALSGNALVSAVAAARPAHIIADDASGQALAAIAGELDPGVRFWQFGGGDGAQLDDAMAALPPETLAADEARPALLSDIALLIYTSGTTGMPKAARVSHRRIAEWSLWFAGLMDTRPEDRLYACLPMFHSVGGVVAIGAMLTGGGSVVIRKRFSAGSFWNDVILNDCTVFQYIGELCRHLLHASPPGAHAGHRLRLCCGNGLRGDVWEAFVARFQIPRVLEFYASTEGNVSLYNVPGRPGAIGHIPGFLANHAQVVLAQVDAESGALLRDSAGRGCLCQPGEAGEALGRIAGRAFEGYTDLAASERKIARDVFAPGDVWYRTGDLMHRDTAGFFYFVDRLGDNFRWKGENIATEWVAGVVRAAPGVRDALVYGVAVAGQEGRAGMAALVADGDFATEAFAAHVAAHLPPYARPVFLRIVEAIPDTATFKPLRAAFVREGYAAAGEVYAHDRAQGAYVRLVSGDLADIKI